MQSALALWLIHSEFEAQIELFPINSGVLKQYVYSFEEIVSTLYSFLLNLHSAHQCQITNQYSQGNQTLFAWVPWIFVKTKPRNLDEKQDWVQT